MEAYYTSYICFFCRKETILITEEIKMTIAQGGHISCSHCNSEEMAKEKATNNFKELMGHSAYKKIHRVIRQVRQ